jgi:hypothetical protein
MTARISGQHWMPVHNFDFSRQGAFISVSVQGTQVARVLSERTADQTYQMAFWLLVPPKHSLLVQRTTPAPIAVIPTDSGTLFKFSVILLPFPKGGDSGGQFLAGALSFVYEADARASMRDYLVFILAAVFAFALERVVDAMSTRKEAVRCEFAFTRAAGSETARDNGFATYSSPASRESVVGFRRGISA